jgi:flavodoxin
MAKILLVYYSRSGTTRKIAEAIKEKINCDLEEIISVKNRAGVFGFLISGKEGSKKESAEIKPTLNDPAGYDLVIVGTPIWSWNLSSVIRTYLQQNSVKFKKLAAYCTMGSSGAENAFVEMERICQLKLVDKISFSTKEMNNGDYKKKIDKFIETVKNNQ